MEAPLWQTLTAALFMTAPHLLNMVPAVRRVGRRLVPISAGVALSYLFLHLYPGVAELQAELLETRLAERPLQWFEHQLFLLALMGLLYFYVLSGFSTDLNPRHHATAFWLSLVSFALYNGLVGYVTAQGGFSGLTLALLAIAFATHFFGNDIGFGERFEHRFPRYGSPVLAASVMGGWLAGRLIEFELTWLAAALAFLTGALTINTIRAELPSAHVGRNALLLTSAALYSILILLIEYLLAET